MMCSKVIFGCLAMLCSSAIVASGLKPFTEQSMSGLTNARDGEPFLLVLWSVECPPCMKELEIFQQLRSAGRTFDLVLISTDSPDTEPQALSILASYGLDDMDAWIFAHDYSERLRYQVDPDWFGELPRAYFYDAQHQRLGVSGALKKEALVQWVDSMDQMKR